MAEAAHRLAGAPLIKVKLGGDGDAERIEAVCRAAPRSRIILDANEAWTPAMLAPLMLLSARHGIALIEQPLPAGNDMALAGIPHPVPVCADESAHLAGELHTLVDRYDCINVKLDKTGGLTAALETRDRAHALGFSVMAGCMVGTSLAMAPAVLLAQACEYADLDGPLILARDREHGLSYADGKVFPPTPALWG
jgi:L-alanine-DL-glutamate epimerase-like enolase superfamily enzyme